MSQALPIRNINHLVTIDRPVRKPARAAGWDLPDSDSLAQAALSGRLAYPAEAARQQFRFRSALGRSHMAKQLAARRLGNRRNSRMLDAALG